MLDYYYWIMNVAATHQISVEEYTRTTYRPDCDYVDGFVVERNVGQSPHSRALGSAIQWFLENGKGQIEPYVAQRLRITATRFRVADFLVVTAPSPNIEVFDQAYLCLEVVSPDDSAATLQDRLEDYHSIGVPNIWILDPWKHRAWTFEAGAWYPVAIDGDFRTKDGHFAMPVRTLLLD